MLSLPSRAGPKPRTRDGIPHQQLDQNPPALVYEQLVERFLAIPETSHGPSLISVPGARALFLPDECPCNPEAFFRGREFAHVHPLNDGSFHMSLSQPDCDHVIERGWGELHPYARTGQIQPTVAMIYAPRDEAEVDTVMAIARASLQYASSPENR
jgi:hypothetical protein